MFLVLLSSLGIWCDVICLVLAFMGVLSWVTTFWILFASVVFVTVILIRAIYDVTHDGDYINSRDEESAK